jgi:acyl carrier protein
MGNGMDKLKLRRFTIKALLATKQQDVDIESIADDTPLGTGGLAMGSLALLQAFVAVENQFGIVFDDAAVAGTTFSTVGEVVNFIGRVIGEREPIKSEGV